MKVRTEPMIDAGVPCVKLTIGDTVAQLTAAQAEDIAESLSRAATASRYESAIAEMLAETFGPGKKCQAGVDRVRQLIEARRRGHN